MNKDNEFRPELPARVAKTTPQASASPEKGPIRLLCEEIGFPWDARLERSDLAVAFVRQLVDQIDHQRFIQAHVERLGGKGPSEGSTEVLSLMHATLGARSRSELMECAALVHDACDRLNPDNAYPTDHLIDQLSSCASAIRFGLKRPCHSRHLAHAAQHVWKQLYGVSLFDNNTPAWERDWARKKLTEALISLLPSGGDFATIGDSGTPNNPLPGAGGEG